MAQTSVFAAWLMLFIKAAIGVVVFSIVTLCILWAIRMRQAARDKKAPKG